MQKAAAHSLPRRLGAVPRLSGCKDDLGLQGTHSLVKSYTQNQPSYHMMCAVVEVHTVCIRNLKAATTGSLTSSLAVSDVCGHTNPPNLDSHYPHV